MPQLPEDTRVDPSNCLPQLGKLRLAHNTLWQVGGKWTQFLLAVGVNIAIARYLGPEPLGLLAYVLSVVNVLVLFSSVGADLYLRSELIRTATSEAALIGSTLALRAVATLAVYGILVLLAAIFPHSPQEQGLLLLAGLGLARSVPDVLQSYFNAHVRAEIVAVSDLSGFVIGSVVKIIAMLAGWGLVAFVIASVLELVLPGCALIVAYRRATSGARCDVSWRVARQVMKESWPLYVSAIAISLYLRVDQLMLQWLSGPQELGYFAASARLVEKLYLLPVALGTTFLPSIIRQQTGGDATRYGLNMQRFYDLNVALSYGIAAVFLLGGTSAAIWALGDKFAPSQAILSVQVFALPLMSLGVARGQYVVAERMFRFAMASNVAGVLLNGVLNALWIPRWAGVGAAYATLATFALVQVGSSFASTETRPWGRMQVKALLLPFRWKACKQLVQEMAALARKS
jgi:O-antigen/teichoic acid export membrane protein